MSVVSPPLPVGCARMDAMLSSTGMPNSADNEGDRLLVDAALRHNRPEHFAGPVALVDFAAICVVDGGECQQRGRGGEEEDTGGAAVPQLHIPQLGNTFSDGDRGERFSSLLLRRTVPSSNTADREYALALLDRSHSIAPGAAAAVASEVDFVALDADHFCFAERVGRLLAALCVDTRATGTPKRLWFRGFGRLAAPLCVLYQSDTDAYLVFRQMYRSCWADLHAAESVSARWRRCVRAAIVEGGGISPSDLGIAGNGDIERTIVTSVSLWFQTGFAGFLPTSQVLLVWDRLVADPARTPEILAFFAGRIIATRRAGVMANLGDPDRVAEALQDLSDVDLDHIAATNAF